MKKIIGIFLATILVFSLIAISVSCASSPESTPTATTTPVIPVTSVSPTAPAATSTPIPTQETPAATRVPYQNIAEDFIKNSSTFKFDGIPGSIKYLQTEPGWTSAFRSTVFTFAYQARHSGHGDRTGQYLAQVITAHTAVILVNIETGEVALAICDKEWDMVHDKNPPVSVSGLVISGGDTTPADGRQDAPRVFVYKVQKADGTIVNVSYTAYPPSPVGDANQAKFTLDLYGGAVNIGDKMEAYGRLNKETNTVTVADQGDYIRTSIPKMAVTGLLVSGGDTTQPGGPLDAPRRFVYQIQKEDGTAVNVAYTAYPPSPVGDAAMARISLSYYDGAPKAGDYLKAYGTYDNTTNTIVVAEEGDFIKTYLQRP